mgnify:CR=1 FL=1
MQDERAPPAWDRLTGSCAERWQLVVAFTRCRITQVAEPGRDPPQQTNAAPPQGTPDLARLGCHSATIASSGRGMGDFVGSIVRFERLATVVVIVLSAVALPFATSLLAGSVARAVRLDARDRGQRRK